MRWDCLALSFLIGKDPRNKLRQGHEDWNNEGETEGKVFGLLLQNTAICHKPLEIYFLSCAHVCVCASYVRKARCYTRFHRLGFSAPVWSFACSHVSKEETE